MFVAVGQNGMRISSAEGATWKNLEIGKEGEIYRAAAFGAGRFVAIGTFGYGEIVYASTADGTKWEARKKAKSGANAPRGIAYGNGTFIAFGGDSTSVGAAKPFVSFSKDGVEWEENTPIAGKYLLRRMVFGKDTWVGVGDRGRIAASPDGKQWTDAEGTKPIDTLADVAFGNGVFVGVGLHGLRRASADGLQWQEPIRGQEGEHLNSVVFTGKQFVAVGAGATYTSADGKAWQRVANSNAPTFATFGAGVFVGTSWRGRLLRSGDGVTWKEVHKCEHPIEAVAFGA